MTLPQTGHDTFREAQRPAALKGQRQRRRVSGRSYYQQHREQNLTRSPTRREEEGRRQLRRVERRARYQRYAARKRAHDEGLYGTYGDTPPGSPITAIFEAAAEGRIDEFGSIIPKRIKKR